MRKLLIATACTGTLLIGAGTAGAASVAITYADGYQSTNPGAGSATANADADLNGRLVASTSAVGGQGTGIPIVSDLLNGLVPGVLPPSGPAEASSQALVSGGLVEASADTEYDITVTFEGADTDESVAGTASSRGFAQVEASVPGPDGHTTTVGIEQTELPSEPGTVVVQFRVTLPYDSSLGVTASIGSLSSAAGQANSSTTESTVDRTIIDITPVG